MPILAYRAHVLAKLGLGKEDDEQAEAYDDEVGSARYPDEIEHALVQAASAPYHQEKR
jgi:hypothetical protein